MSFKLPLLDRAIAAKNWAAAATIAHKGWEEGVRDHAFLAQAAKAFYYHGDVNRAAQLLHLLTTQDPYHAEGHNQLGMILVAAHRWEEGFGYLRKAVELAPHDPIAIYNLALCHLRRGDVGPHVVTLLERAITLKPDWPAPLLKLAMYCALNKMPQRGLELFQQLMHLQPDEWQAYFGTGLIFQDLNKLAEARDYYATAMEMAPEEMSPLFNLLRVLVMECDFDAYAPILPKFRAMLERRQQGSSALIACMVEERADLQKTAAELLCMANVEPACSAPPLTTVHTPVRGPKIRLGFLTDDLREHPVGHLMCGIFEAFDRDRFETVVFAYGPPSDSSVTTRCKAAATEWMDVDKLGLRATAEAIAAAGIDILIDMKGHTQNCRTMVYGYRPAPVSVNFLGHPATMGHRAWDYILADAFIVPHGHEPFYSEKIVRLPGCYQPNDQQRPLGKPLSRADYGLPHDACVFASFNQPQKFTPHLLAIWMDILRAVPDSVLWLRAFDNLPNAKPNLLATATRHGIDPARLVFAPKTKTQDEHMARYAVADLALDTYPYNSQTTCSDALWGGCPLLTKPGEAFASRVAGSLVLAAGLPELVVDSWARYTQLAIELAHDRPRLAAMRTHLETNRLRFSMFDTARYMHGLQHAFELMHQRRLAGLAPDHLTVEDGTANLVAAA